MYLYRTLSRITMDDYLSYLDLMSTGDWRKVIVPDEKISTCFFLGFSDMILKDISQKHFSLNNGIYKVVDEDQYVYIHLEDRKIINILFDQFQLDHIQNIRENIVELMENYEVLQNEYEEDEMEM